MEDDDDLQEVIQLWFDLITPKKYGEGKIKFTHILLQKWSFNNDLCLFLVNSPIAARENLRPNWKHNAIKRPALLLPTKYCNRNNWLELFTIIRRVFYNDYLNLVIRPQRERDFYD